MLRLIFPPKKHLEDANDSMLLMAKLLLVFGVFSLVWSGVRIVRCIHTISSYQETVGELVYDDLVFDHHLRAAAYSFTVNGKQYASDQLAIGGRPFGKIPPPGPVKVYYDPANPAESVLFRRPVETVYLALVIGLGAPFLARTLWDWA